MSCFLADSCVPESEIAEERVEANKVNSVLHGSCDHIKYIIFMSADPSQEGFSIWLEMKTDNQWYAHLNRVITA